MCERISHQEVAEFVVNARHGNRQTGENRQPDADHQQKKKDSTEQAPAREWPDVFPDRVRDSPDGFPEQQLEREKNSGSN